MPAFCYHNLQLRDKSNEIPGRTRENLACTLGAPPFTVALIYPQRDNVLDNLESNVLRMSTSFANNPCNAK